jgi:hypothetical protein
VDDAHGIRVEAGNLAGLLIAAATVLTAFGSLMSGENVLVLIS